MNTDFHHFDIQHSEDTVMTQALKNTTRISTDLTVAGRLSGEDLQQAAEDGFRSVLDLRSPGESSYLLDEETWALAAQLNYISTPAYDTLLTEDLIFDLFLQIRLLPKPLLVHCSTDLTLNNSWPTNAYTITLMYLATREGFTSAQALDRSVLDGFDYDTAPALKELLSSYIDSH